MIARYTTPEMSNIWSERNKFQKLLDVEIAVLEEWASLKKVPKKSLENIRQKARFDIENINVIEKRTNHDVIAFIEDVSRHLGADARFFHMGLTSNDVIDTGLGVLIKEAIDVIISDLKRFEKVLEHKAKKYRNTVCIARTHGVHAEPTIFGLKFALYYAEVKRHIELMNWVKSRVCVGKISGAVGNYANISPVIEKNVCKRLGLGLEEISTQVVQRDRHANLLNAIAVVGATLEKIAMEIRHLQKTEVREVEEPFKEGQKGSSAMPHKRNPIMCERVCGLARVLRSNALAGMENISLWHERDISHSSVERIIIPDSTTLLDYTLNVMIDVVDGLIVYPENIKRSLECTKGLIFSQRILLALIDKGADRLGSYNVIQRNAMKVWSGESNFKELLSQDPDLTRYLSKKELDKCFDVNYYLKNVDKIYKRIGL